MKFEFTFSVFTLFSLWIAGTTAQADDYNITSVSYKGPGCEPGTVGHHFNDGAKGVTTNFTNFTVTSPGFSASECSVTLNVSVPDGYMFRVNNTSFDFSFQLAHDPSANLFLYTGYSFPGKGGMPAKGEFDVVGGPAREDHSIYGVGFRGDDDIPWSTCGGDIAITLTTRISTGAPSDAISTYTIHTLSYGAEPKNVGIPFVLETC